MDLATIDYGKFTRSEELEAFRKELTAFIGATLKYPCAVLIRITAKEELAQLAGATDPAQLFNYATGCGNRFSAGYAFVALGDHLKAVAARQSAVSTTHISNRVRDDDSYALSCAVSLERDDHIVIVAVGGITTQDHGEEFAKPIAGFVKNKLSK